MKHKVHKEHKETTKSYDLLFRSHPHPQKTETTNHTNSTNKFFLKEKVGVEGLCDLCGLCG